MKKLILAVALAAVATMAVVASASADVPRYQTQTGTLTVTLEPTYGYVHQFNITLNPCDNSFTGTGSSVGNVAAEHITGTLVDGILAYSATYDGSAYSWSYSGPLAGGTAADSTGLHFGITSTLTDLLAPGAYKNHGDFVKQGGDPESCIGRPVAWSQSGTIDSASLTGSTITLPDEGDYRITVSGTWDNGVWYGVDAEYTEQSPGVWGNSWAGYPTTDFGDLQLNGQFVDWGAYNPNHVYSLTTALPAGTANLSVWDMWGDLVKDGQRGPLRRASPFARHRPFVSG